MKGCLLVTTDGTKVAHHLSMCLLVAASWHCCLQNQWYLQYRSQHIQDYHIQFCISNAMISTNVSSKELTRYNLDSVQGKSLKDWIPTDTGNTEVAELLSNLIVFGYSAGVSEIEINFCKLTAFSSTG